MFALNKILLLVALPVLEQPGMVLMVAVLIFGTLCLVAIGAIGFVVIYTARRKSLSSKPAPAAAPQALPPDPMKNATLIASTPAALPKASVTVLRAPANLALQGRNFPVDQFPFIIGRSEGTWNIVEPNVSRKHAQITRGESGRDFYITDLNSSNGVVINGQRIPPGHSVHLQNGLEFDLGPNITLRFDIS